MDNQQAIANYIAAQIIKKRDIESIVKECQNIDFSKKIPGNKEIKTYNLKDIEQDGMTFKGYASTWSMDETRDIIKPGAFKRSIDTRFAANKIKVLWQHFEPIGIPVVMREDEKGLWTETKLSDTQLGRDAMTLIKDKVIDRMSIGFSIPAGKADLAEDGITRTIYEAKLYEYSLVTFPANEEAVIEMASRLARNLNSETISQESKSKIKNLFKDSSLDTPNIDSNIIHSMKELKTILQKRN